MEQEEFQSNKLYLLVGKILDCMYGDCEIEYDGCEGIISFLPIGNQEAEKKTITIEEINYFYSEYEKLNEESQENMVQIKEDFTSFIKSLSGPNSTPLPENKRCNVYGKD